MKQNKLYGFKRYLKNAGLYWPVGEDVFKDVMCLIKHDIKFHTTTQCREMEFGTDKRGKYIIFIPRKFYLKDADIKWIKEQPDSINGATK